MSTLRSLRLLGAVEAGTVDGTQLQVYLTNAGRASEFSALLANRGQSRRMAGSALTMAAIVISPKAIDIVFAGATSFTNAACSAVVASPIAMSSVSNNTASLQGVSANAVAWGIFVNSIYYEVNVRTILALLAGVLPANYPTVDSLIASSISMGDIAAVPYAMSAAVASLPTMNIIALNASAMSLVAGNPVSIDIVAKQTSIMGAIANSSVAMTEIVSRAIATNKMASYPGAITAISKVAAAWTSFLAGPNFATNLPLILANLIGVTPTSYPTLDSIIADATALGKVAASTQAVQALSSNTAAMTTLAGSTNISIVLSSATAMGVIGTSTSAMTSFLNSSGAWAGLFGSSVAKGYIIASTALVNVVAANAALITYLTGLSKTLAAIGIPDGNATALQPFPGVPAKLLTLSAKEVGIAATYSPYNFGGSAMTGSQAGATLSLSGTGVGGQPAHIAGYIGMTWNLQGVGVTAATLPIITYVDMT